MLSTRCIPIVGRAVTLRLPGRRKSRFADTWCEALNNGVFAGWHQIGGSDTHYSVVGVGDFFGTGTDDILLRNNTTDDIWFEAISNGLRATYYRSSERCPLAWT